MKTACLFAAFSLALSVSAAAVQGNNNNNGNKVISLQVPAPQSNCPSFQNGAANKNSSKGATGNANEQSSLSSFFFFFALCGVIIYSICSSSRSQGTRNWIREQWSKLVYFFIFYFLLFLKFILFAYRCANCW